MRRDASAHPATCGGVGRGICNGLLRSIQFAWAPGHACYVRFMDDQLNYAFDVSYEEAGQILGSYLNEPQVKYIGHHLPADLPWMHHRLKLEVYRKSILDTEFALQTCDEHLPLGLDWLALMFTDLGRYDMDLIIWKKVNKLGKDEGYGTIPDDILIPYACADCDTCIRCWQQIVRDLMSQNLWDYYCRVVHPFAVDVFSHFTINGLTMDRERMDQAARPLLAGQGAAGAQFAQHDHPGCGRTAWRPARAHRPGEGRLGD